MAGAAAIIAVLLLGLLRKGSFTANWVPRAPPGTIRSGGDAAVVLRRELIEVATGVTIVIFTLLGMRHDWTPDEADGDDHR